MLCIPYDLQVISVPKMFPLSIWLRNQIIQTQLSVILIVFILEKAAGFPQPNKFIINGTKWCGDGNIAENDQDLGLFKDTDACCRQHDHCPDSIEGKSQKYGLDNPSPFTKSHCDCDEKFASCLQIANDTISLEILFAYFDIIERKCFKLDHPIKECIERHKGACVNYRKDTDKPKIYQWFDNLYF